MTFTPIIPTTWLPLRQTINDFLNAIVAGFQAQYPTVIRQQWSEIPPSFAGEVPLIFLGDIVEDIRFSGSTSWSGTIDGAGLRHTVFSGTIEYVDRSPDNVEANTRANSFADYMREVFAANARIYPPGIFQQTGLTESAITDGPMTGFMHLVVTYTFTSLNGDPVTT